MAAATYAQHPDNAYAGYGAEADPYNANNAGAYEQGYGATGANDYEYPADDYSNGYPNDQQQQQQPAYPNNYQQAPYSSDSYDAQQPQNGHADVYGQVPQNVPSNGYGQQPQNSLPNTYPQQPQHVPPNMYGQQPQHAPPNMYEQQHQNIPVNTYAQQPPQNAHPNPYAQQPSYPNDYEQSPHANGGYPIQQAQHHPQNAYGQQQPPDNQQQSFYPNEHQQSPYNNENYPPQQPPMNPPKPYGQQQQQQQHLPPQQQQQQQQHQQQFNGYSNLQGPKIHRKSIPTNNNTDNYNDMNPQYADPRHHQQTFVAPTQRDPSSPVNDQYQRNQTYDAQPQHQATNRPPKQEQQRYQQPPSSPESEHQFPRPRISETSVARSSPSNDNGNYKFEPIPKASFTQQESKSSKPNGLRDPATKKKEDSRDSKHRDSNALSNQRKFSPTKSKGQNASSQTEEPRDLEKVKRNAKQSDTRNKRDNDSYSDDERRDREKPNHHSKRSRSRSKSRKNRRDHYRSEDDYSSDDECRRCRSRKTAAFSDNNFDKHSRLPPLRRLGKSSHHDSHGDQRSPSKHTSQRRFSQFDSSPSFGPQSSRRGRHQMLRDVGNRPSQHQSRDRVPDRDQRNGKPKRLQRDRTRSTSRHGNNRDGGTKSQRSQLAPLKSTGTHRRGQHFCDKCGRSSADSTDEYSSGVGGRGALKPNEIPFSHPPIRSVTYVENERIRAVRDAQGFYIPYKQYTLKDYNELKKSFNLNPYGDPKETSIDRKELLKKGQEYGTFIEKQVIDGFEPRQAPSKDNQSVRPWHGGISNLPDPEEANKRERAIEYAKVQVRKYQEMGTTRGRSQKSDSDRYCPKHLPKLNEWPDKINQLPNDYD